MGTIRVEAVPVRSYGLGLFRFDHLQLVFQDETDLIDSQDYWFVIEGIQDGPLLSAALGASGESGRLSLGVANGASRDELVAKIGTPDTRGSRIVKSGPDAFSTWASMAGYAGAIEDQKYPYIPYSWPFSSAPTINSTSLVNAVLWSVGVDLNNLMPFNLRLSPGPETLLGTSQDEAIGVGGSYTTAAAGGGGDTLSGSTTTLWLEKLYGGSGNDSFKWSYGPNLYNGGQPRMPYANDGTDVVDYKGIGRVHFSANEYAIENKTPDVFASFDGGSDQLFSIERIVWDSETDIVSAGPGLDLLERPIELDLQGQSGGKGDTLGMSDGATPLIVNVVTDGMISVQAESNEGLDAGFWVSSAEWLIGSGADDKIYAGATLTGVEGNDGDDILDARLAEAFTGISPLGYDIELNGGGGDDTLVSGEGRTFASGGTGADQFVLSTMTSGDGTVEFVIDDADSSDSLFIPYDLFKISRGSFEGSTLFQLTGAAFKIDDIISPSYFMWGEPDDDEPQGNIEFVGQISYEKDGGDLLIKILQGHPETFNIDYGPGEPPGPSYTLSVGELQTETIVRVRNWSEGILGIEFPLTWDNDVFAQAGSLNDYPGFKDAINTQTAPDKFIAPLAERPAAYLPKELGQSAPVAAFAMRAFSFPAPTASQPTTDGTDGDDDLSAPAGGPFTFTGRSGNDTITGSDGGDLIDGGAGADSMSGGRGNDTYLVDDAGDAIIEDARGGFDTVYSAIDYTLSDTVEHLNLDGDATSATGNALRNKLQGNDYNNVLTGLGGNDTLAGNAGNDLLIGGVGSDGYIWELGDGSDTIVETPDDPGSKDVLVLTGDLSPDDVVFIRKPDQPDDLLLAFPDGGGITINGFYAAGAQTIEEIVFASGVTWSAIEISSRAANPVATRNLAPAARDDAFVATGGLTVVLPVGALLDNDNDADGDALLVVSINAIAGGTATLNADGSIALTAESDGGPLSFDYVVTDSRGAQSRAHADIVFVPNSSPEIIATTLEPVQPGAPSAGSVVARDADGDDLYYSIPDGHRPSHGTVALAADGTFSYAPDQAATGRESFAIAVSDGLTAPTVTQFSFEVVAPNAAPVARDDSGLSGPGGATLRIAAAALLANDTDPDGDTLHIVTADDAHNGGVAIAANGDILFTPDRGYVGAASFRYTIADDSDVQSSAVVAIDVTNTPPVARDDTADEVAAGADTRIPVATLLANDSDADGHPLAILSVADGSGGSVFLADGGMIIFSADPAYAGIASFTYTVSDGYGSSTAEVVLEVLAPPPQPHYSVPAMPPPPNASILDLIAAQHVAALEDLAHAIEHAAPSSTSTASDVLHPGIDTAKLALLTIAGHHDL